MRDTNQIVQGAATLVSQLQLNFESLASNARSLVEAHGGLLHFENIVPQGARITIILPASECIEQPSEPNCVCGG